MGKKRFKHKKSTICYQMANAVLYEQNLNVIAEFMEQQKGFCKVDRNTRYNKLTRDDVIAYGKALVKLSCAVQQNICILEKQYGFTVGGITEKAAEGAEEKEGQHHEGNY